MKRVKRYLFAWDGHIHLAIGIEVNRIHIPNEWSYVSSIIVNYIYNWLSYNIYSPKTFLIGLWCHFGFPKKMEKKKDIWCLIYMNMY